MIGLKLKLLRREFDYSQEEIAKYLNIPRSAVSQLETDKRTLSAFELLVLSDLFGIDMRYLLIADVKGIKAHLQQSKINIAEHKHYLSTNL